jgi:FG-GAP-like repeat
MMLLNFMLLSIQQPVFEATEVLPLPYQYIACRDLDLDGDQDILAIENSAPNYFIRSLLNDGSGNFTPGPISATPLPLGFGFSAYLAQFGDVSGDGQEDLILKRGQTAQTADQYLEVYLGNGLGAFQPALPVPTTSPRKNYTLAQLDSDPELELVVAAANALQVVEYQAGALVLTQVVAVPGMDLPAGSSLQAFDSDGDGIDTLFGSIAVGPQVPFAKLACLIDLTSTGSALVLPLSPALQTQTYTEYHRLGTLGDIDQDGDLDIVVVSSLDPKVSVHVWTNDGAGGFSAYNLSALPFEKYGVTNTGAGQASVLMGDWDQDGVQDLLGVRKAGWGITETPLLMRISGNSPGVFDQIDYLPTWCNRPIAALPAGTGLRFLDPEGRIPLLAASAAGPAVAILFTIREPQRARSRGRWGPRLPLVSLSRRSVDRRRQRWNR